MGLPFVVLNMVSVLMFKGLGIGDAQIALWTSLIMMPWTLKFLWSPFLEMFKTKKFFVVLTQMVTGAGFALVALALQLPFFFAICIALLAVIAFSGATHDVATDGVYMSELNKQDQAKYIGWQGAFYNIAKIVASGGLVWLAGALLVGFGGVEGATEAVRHEATRHAWMTVMLILAAVMLLLTAVNFGGADEHERVLRITIPESLDYDGLFDDLFEKYTKSCVLERVKTSNMGTLYELTYRVTLPDDHAPKAFLDELRCRNGNLNITCGREATKDAL